MKRIYVLFLLFFIAPAVADAMTSFTNLCGDDLYRNFGVSFEPISYTCPSGQFLPADTLGCVPCPSGAMCSGGTYSFNEMVAHGVMYDAPFTQTQSKLCSVSFENMRAEFEPIQYTCSSGQFLPADTLGCVPCPNGATCSGGTFAFSETNAHGVTHYTPITQNQSNLCSVPYEHMKATFEPIEYTCNAGYYLPADETECAQCPSGSACVGGTYSFNETTDQGIVACASGTFAPTGSAVCYQHILHVGDDIVYLRSTKLTTPSLNIQIGNDIFYANMTTVPTYMNKDSSHYLHILYEGNDYYVCDDTTYQE